MTEQTPDILLLNNQTYYLKSFPLDDLKLRMVNTENDSIEINSGCWRGYQATWKVRNDSLFLVKMTDCYNAKQINIRKYFNQRTPKIEINEPELFANWYNAQLVNYEHPFLNKEESQNYL